jgi:hypothetical protein
MLFCGPRASERIAKRLKNSNDGVAFVRDNSWLNTKYNFLFLKGP